MGGFDAVFEGVKTAVAFVSSGAGHGVGVWMLAIILLWSSVPKLRNPMRAAVAIYDFRLTATPRAWQGLALGGLEMALSLFLLSGLAPSITLGLVALLFLAFLTVIVRSLLAGEEFPCYCFGGEEDGISTISALRAAFLALLAIALAAGAESAIGPLEGASGLQLITAVALLGSVVLMSQYRQLANWNRDTVEFLRSREEAL